MQHSRRIQLQLELDQLIPVPDDDLERAAELLENFTTHWERLDGDPESQHELVKLIVERAYVEDEKVVAMTLRSNYHLVLGHKANGQLFMKLTHYTPTGATGMGHSRVKLWW